MVGLAIQPMRRRLRQHPSRKRPPPPTLHRSTGRRGGAAEHRPFDIFSESLRAAAADGVIDPQDANVITEHTRTWYGNSQTPNQATEGNHGFLVSLQKRRYRYIEKFIYIHDVIYALGYFQSLGGGRHVPNNHKMTGEVIRQWKKNYDWILENFDKDGNGEIDLQEWDQVRKAAAQEAEKRRSDMAKMPTTHVLSKTPDKKHPFILSNHSQKKLAKRYRYYAATSLAGSAFCGLFVVVLVI